MELRYLDDQLAIREDRHAAEREYAREMADFRRRYQDLLLLGDFADEQPIRQKNPAIIAKAFTAGDRLAVALWNDSATGQTLDLSVPGYVLEHVASVEGELSAVLPASLKSQEIACAVFTKQGGTPQ